MEKENSFRKEKKKDDDEDKRKPQYVPKKGKYYQHDDRTMAEGSEVEEKEVESNTDAEEPVAEAAGPKKAGGKVWTKKDEKWEHDLYDEDDQKPKSTQELIDKYGYDIRNQEAPPKARRCQSYGRGPNKYTAPQQTVLKNKQEENPDLGSRGRNRDKQEHTPSDPPKLDQRRHESPRAKSKSPAPRKSTSEGGDRDRSKGEEKRMERGRVVDSPPSKSIPPQPVVAEKVPGVVGTPGARVVGRGRGFIGTGKQRPTEFFTASRGRGPLPPAFKKQPLNNQIDDSLKHAAEMLEQDFSHNTNNVVEEIIIPSSERKDGGVRSKRYSTQHSPPHNIPYYTQPPPTYFPTPLYNSMFLPPGPPPTTPSALANPQNASPQLQASASLSSNFDAASAYFPTPLYNSMFLPPGPPPTTPSALANPQNASPQLQASASLSSNFDAASAYFPTPLYNSMFLPPGPPPTTPSALANPQNASPQLQASASLSSNFDAASAYFPTPLYNSMFLPPGPPPTTPSALANPQNASPQLQASASLSPNFDAASAYFPTPLYNSMFLPPGPPPTTPSALANPQNASPQLQASASLSPNFDAASAYLPNPAYNSTFLLPGPPPTTPSALAYPTPSLPNYVPPPALNPIAMQTPGSSLFTSGEYFDRNILL